MGPKKSKGKKQPKKKTAAAVEIPVVTPPVVDIPVEGGGETPSKVTTGGGGVTPREESDADEFHDAREDAHPREGSEDPRVGNEEDRAMDHAAEDTDDNEELGELPEPMQPLKMYFDKSQYWKPMKIITRCYNYKAVRHLERILDPEELSWFTEHPQFAHFFHMARDTNHKSMGMWMLLLRTASTEKKMEVWFIVNGVPVRYSMVEHALLSGLNCKEYPSNYKEFGDTKFVEEHFESDKVSYEQIRDKFLSMKNYSESRLQIAVLYFLSSVITGVPKQGLGAPTVEPLFLKYVSNLKWCKYFPWGRLSFQDTLKQIKHTMDSCKGVPKPNWCFPSFILPLEVCTQ